LLSLGRKSKGVVKEENPLSSKTRDYYRL
jgi:hypothetical protein